MPCTEQLLQCHDTTFFKSFISPASHERLLALYDRLDELDASKAIAKAGYILHGLGFTKDMQHTKVSVRNLWH